MVLEFAHEHTTIKATEFSGWSTLKFFAQLNFGIKFLPHNQGSGGEGGGWRK